MSWSQLDSSTSRAQLEVLVPILNLSFYCMHGACLIKTQQKEYKNHTSITTYENKIMLSFSSFTINKGTEEPLTYGKKKSFCIHHLSASLIYRTILVRTNIYIKCSQDSCNVVFTFSKFLMHY